MLKVDQKIVIVKRPTRMEGLVARHATAGQAKFQMVRAKLAAGAGRGAGVDPMEGARLDEQLEVDALREFDETQEEAREYAGIISYLRAELAALAPVHVMDRQYLPNYVFGPADVVVTVGQDGLVANTAKYALGLPIVAINPDPKRIDGILLPFGVGDAIAAVRKALRREAPMRRVTLAEAVLVDGQRLLAFNDLFIGAKSHVSARYRVEFDGREEQHSSSGIIVSTGAGSTGWLSSVMNMAAGLGGLAGGGMSAVPRPKLVWEDPRLIFVTREPFLSKTSGISLTAGTIEAGKELVIESSMTGVGVIFSDGVEADFLEFNTGAIARVRAAREHATLVVGR